METSFSFRAFTRRGQVTKLCPFSPQYPQLYFFLAPERTIRIDRSLPPPYHGDMDTIAAAAVILLTGAVEAPEVLDDVWPWEMVEDYAPEAAWWLEENDRYSIESAIPEPEEENLRDPEKQRAVRVRGERTEVSE